MNILIYTHHYPVPEGFGIQPDTKVVHYFAKALREKGHAVQVFYLYYTPVKEIVRNRFRDILPTEADYTFEGVPVHLVKYQMLTPRRSHPERFQARIINGMIRRMKRRLGWKPDRVFIHFPTTFACLTETLSDGVPTLGDFHNMDVQVLKKDRGDPDVLDYVSRIRTWGFRNQRVYEYLSGTCGRMPVPVYSGIDRRLLADRAAIGARIASRGEGLRIVYAGQLIPLKNVDALIRAVRTLAFGYSLKIIGDGPEMGALRALAADDPNVEFTGWLSRDETIRAMGGADAFAMVSSPETYGLVYLEAMAQGCIPVASRGEGFDGLIVDGVNGFLAAPGDAAETADALARIHALSDAARAEMIERGYALACSMTEDRTAEGFLEACAGARPNQ